MPQPPARLTDPHFQIDSFANAKDIEDCWDYLCQELKLVGFDKVLYARKPKATKANFHNLAETIILSTYGPEVDQFFIDHRGYLEDMTTQWSLANKGAISWRHSREAYLAGQLSKKQEQVHLVTRELGLVAGLTFSSPVPVDLVRSGFGLCFVSGDQDEADEVWKSLEPDLTSLLKLFELCISRLPHVPEQQLLEEREAEALKMFAEGKTATDISEILDVHRRTVENLLGSCRKKLEAGNTTNAVYVAITQGQL